MWRDLYLQVHESDMVEVLRVFMLSSHLLLYLPLIETALILNESLVYEWQVQQHMSRQHVVFCLRRCGLMSF